MVREIIGTLSAQSSIPPGQGSLPVDHAKDLWIIVGSNQDTTLIKKILLFFKLFHVSKIVSFTDKLGSIEFRVIS